MSDLPAGARPRPPYKPRDVKCAQCGAGLAVRDEAARMVVCDYCGSKLDLSEAEARVLAQGSKHKQQFPFRIGDRFVFDGGRYEVVARLVLLEDGDPSERTREYLLYSPRRGTLCLDEYRGHWTLSRPVHVMPRHDDVFGLDPGATVETHDGRRWVMEEVGEYKVSYVDGALPWRAVVGDRSTSAELSAADGSPETYEVERARGEVEFNRGRALSAAEVRRALVKKSGVGEHAIPEATLPRASAGQKRIALRRMMAAAALATAFNFGACLVAGGRGTQAWAGRLEPAELAQETLTPAFDLPAGVARIDVDAVGLDGAWEAVDLALVTEADERVTHVLDSDLEYYHGVEDGESWSEGSRGEMLYVRVSEPGRYRLLVRAQGGRGEGEAPGAPVAALQLSVLGGARVHWPFLAAAVFSAVVLALVLYGWMRWRGLVGEDD